MSTDRDALAAKVRWEEGLISPEIFIDQDIYEAELDRVFGRSWLFLAHDSMIPEPGDFFATYMGSDPVIVSRQGDGSVRAFLNVCRHRGMKVCRAEDGNAKTFTCTYHGWVYDTGGDLIGVPQQQLAYGDTLSFADNGLVQVAQVASYKGLIFGNFDPDAPPLEDYLGMMKYWIDGIVDHAENGIEVIPGVIRWTIKGNWKIAAEQFAGDGYHVQTSHASSLGDWGSQPDLSRMVTGQSRSRLGHGISFLMVTDEFQRYSDSPVDAYHRRRREQAVERVGERGLATGNFNVFPNFSGLPGMSNLRVWHPKGPNKFEIWSFTIVEKDAPDAVKLAQQRASAMTEGAAGMVEKDDAENWDLIGGILETGWQARKMDWNYQMGLGTEVESDPRFPGTVAPMYFGEGPQRGFYRRWLEFMTSEGWPHVEETGTPIDQLVTPTDPHAGGAA